MLPYDTVVSFGDSFSSQCGIRNSVTHDRHTWTDFQQGLHGNPIYNNCSANEGYNYLNFLTDCIGDNIDPLNCPVRLIDLAFARAETSPHEIESAEGEEANTQTTLTLRDQIDEWTQKVRPNIDIQGGKTIATIWFGLNDLAALEGEGLEEKVEHEDALGVEIEILRRLKVIEDAMDILLASGIQNFLILNVPLDLIDGASLILEWNRLLRRRTSLWQSNNPGIPLYLFDTFDLYNQFLGYPERYGFTDITQYCFSARMENPEIDCSQVSGSPAYLRMDWVHWTTRAHKYLAEAITEYIVKQQATTDNPGAILVPESGISRLVFRYHKSMIMGLLILTIALASALLFVFIRYRTSFRSNLQSTKYQPVRVVESLPLSRTSRSRPNEIDDEEMNDMSEVKD